MKKIFTLIALGVVALSANAQEEKVLFENGGTYTDEQVLTSDNAQLQLGKDIKKAAKWDNKATTSSEYLAPFTQSVDVDGEMKDRIVYIVGGNNPQDLEENGKKGASGYDGSTEKGMLPRSGTYYKFTPTVNGTALVGIIFNAGKDFFVVDGTDAVEEDKIATIDDVPTNVGKALTVVNADALLAPEALTFVSIDGTETTMTVSDKAGLQAADKFYGTVQFEAKANRTYYIFCSGSKLSCFGYVFTPSGDDPQPAEEVIWENPDPESGLISWAGTYRFGLEGHDGANECIATFPQETWDKLKTQPFYMQFKGDNYQIRVTNGWWTVQWLGTDEDIAYWGTHSDLITDNGDGTYNLKVDFSIEPIDPIVETLDEKHLLFTGSGYTPLKLFFAPAEPTGIDAVKTTQNENAPIYNLAGQRVSASYKGVVIQNGRKFINK